MIMHRRFRINQIILLFLSLLLLHSLLEAGERKGCYLCGMYLDIYASTRHVVVYVDGTKKETCSLACAAKLYKNRTKEIKKILVSDYPSKALIEADKARYLEGSDVPGVMSYTSRIAFRHHQEAIDFQKKHGGRIISFQEALKHELDE